MTMRWMACTAFQNWYVSWKFDNGDIKFASQLLWTSPFSPLTTICVYLAFAYLRLLYNGWCLFGLEISWGRKPPLPSIWGGKLILMLEISNAGFYCFCWWITLCPPSSKGEKKKMLLPTSTRKSSNLLRLNIMNRNIWAALEFGACMSKSTALILVESKILQWLVYVHHGCPCYLDVYSAFSS